MVWLIIVMQIDSVAQNESTLYIYVHLIISNVPSAKIVYLPCLCRCAVTDLIPILLSSVLFALY